MACKYDHEYKVQAVKLDKERPSAVTNNFQIIQWSNLTALRLHGKVDTK